MKVKSLSGRLETWNLTGYTPLNDDMRPRSELHLNARKLLREEFVTESILEEVPLASEGLFFDFYLPLRKIAIEVHGQQHFTYCKFYHSNIDGFKRAKANDSRKAEWCQLNNIRLVIFPFDKTVEEWREILYE